MQTTDSNHDPPILRDRGKEVALNGPDRLWVVDLTYFTIATGFVYVAVILDAWSRRVIGKPSQSLSEAWASIATQDAIFLA